MHSPYINRYGVLIIIEEHNSKSHYKRMREIRILLTFGLFNLETKLTKSVIFYKEIM